MNYSTTNSSGTSSVAPGVGHFLLFPSPHGRGFVAFCALLKLIPTYIPGWGEGGGVGVYFDWCITRSMTTLVLILSHRLDDTEVMQKHNSHPSQTVAGLRYIFITLHRNVSQKLVKMRRNLSSRRNCFERRHFSQECRDMCNSEKNIFKRTSV